MPVGNQLVWVAAYQLKEHCREHRFICRWSSYRSSVAEGNRPVKNVTSITDRINREINGKQVLQSWQVLKIPRPLFLDSWNVCYT